MAEEIVNRVANNQNLITIDLEDYYPEGKRVLFDIKDWLFEGLILREKDFRAQVKSHDWQQYKDQYIALFCSTDAIIPGWAYLLLTSALQPYVKKVVAGDLEILETILYTEIINNLDISAFQDKLLIIKGCSNKPVPAKSIMYGEACSSVPLFKRK